MVIAIDGPAGAGKSTVARGVAAALGSTYLDSGAMYRCVAVAALERGVDLDDADALGALARGLRIELDGGVRLDGREVGRGDPRSRGLGGGIACSVHPAVREAMVERQRGLIASGDYVAEGRDIGTVVSPDAPLKVFLTATDAGARAPARRRERGGRPPRLATEMRARDERDRDREHGALRAADDAVSLDTTGLTVEEVVERVVDLARERGIA